MTVQQLRSNGYKVRVLHFRDSIEKETFGGIRTRILPKGGMTKVIIDSPNGDHFEGISRCSKEDNYDKKLGVRIAIGRSGVTNDRLQNSNL